MKTVWKFSLEHLQEQRIFMPKGAKILSAQKQVDRLCLWAEVDPEEKTESIPILIYGTGHEIRESNLEFIATVQSSRFVWHIYRKCEA